MRRTNGRGSPVVPAPAIDRGSDLFAPRDASAYNASEQEYSRYVGDQLEMLLKGDLNCLALMRRYHQDPGLLGAPLPRNRINREALRVPVIEDVLSRVLIFLQTGMPGGPVVQESRNGRLIERQLHTTRFPHIVIERIDTYETGSGAALETEWLVKRMQNQHVATRISRMMDIANLGLEFFRASR
jgi:hypothetical protein